jgi:putative AlgH/UPF0301 family transcriptional regulator
MDLIHYRAGSGYLTKSLVGSVLVAHPLIHDNKLAKVVFLVGDDDSKNPTGVILNSPTHRLWGDIDSSCPHAELADVPIYFGGNHEKNSIILTGWVFRKSCFELYYSISAETALSLKSENAHVQLRGFAGYMPLGDQIYEEIAKGLWILYGANDIADLIDTTGCGEKLWQHLVLGKCPDAVMVCR